MYLSKKKILILKYITTEKPVQNIKHDSSLKFSLFEISWKIILLYINFSIAMSLQFKY